MKVGGRVWFQEEKLPYTVRAMSERYWLCMKPFAARKTYLYCVIDWMARLRGPSNHMRGFGPDLYAEGEAQKMVDEFEKGHVHFSTRSRPIPLNIRKMETPK